MNRKAIYMCAFCLAGLLAARPCPAQNTNRFSFNVGGGFTEPVRWSESRLDTGFNLTAGAGINFIPQFGVQAEFGYNHLGVSGNVLNSVGAPNGASRIYSLTLNPIVHLNPRGRFDAYVIGGGGYYRRTIEFTQPTVTTFTAFDPFFGVFFPAAVPSNEVLGSFTQNRGGLNIGGGVSFRIKGDSNLKFYAESRYHYIFTDQRTTILPVTFGLRW
jgi:opacity protein-like surface antigen